MKLLSVVENIFIYIHLHTQIYIYILIRVCIHTQNKNTSTTNKKSGWHETDRTTLGFLLGGIFIPLVRYLPVDQIKNLSTGMKT